MKSVADFLLGRKGSEEAHVAGPVIVGRSSTTSRSAVISQYLLSRKEITFREYKPYPHVYVINEF